MKTKKNLLIKTSGELYLNSKVRNYNVLINSNSKKEENTKAVNPNKWPKNFN
jgi:hypothetical protein